MGFQGMNAAVRATVRMAIYLGCKAYFIKEGYQGGSCFCFVQFEGFGYYKN